MADLEGVGLVFAETMSGWIGAGALDFESGELDGKDNNTSIRFDVRIRIDNLAHFFDISHHTAGLTGRLNAGPFGDNIPIEDGRFGLFTIDPETGHRQMTYTFRFVPGDGKQVYFFHGVKELKDDPGVDLLDDMTTLFTTVYQGPDETAPVYGKGILRFKLTDMFDLMSSLEVLNSTGVAQAYRAKIAFISFAFDQTRSVYLRNINPLYNTAYKNLVLSGEFKDNQGAHVPFFLVSGVHDRDFPWGDGEVFSDVLLLLGDAQSGYRRFCLSDRLISGLTLDVRAGRYRFQGILYEITDGFSTSFSKIRKKAPSLKPVQVNLEIDFEAKAYSTTPLPFLTANNILADLATALKKALERFLPSERALGIFITPHSVTVTSGRLTISGDSTPQTFIILPETTFGEAERSTLRNVKAPIMLYNYICGLNPKEHAARVQILADTLRSTPQYWIKDHLEAIIGDAISHLASKELRLKDGRITVRELGGDQAGSADKSRLFKSSGPPLLEVNNDHFPTAVFQRRIIQVIDPDGSPCLALEEHMNPMRLESINSGRSCRVAAVRSQDKFEALARVLEQSRFNQRLETLWAATQKTKGEFQIAIKPNFMFAYNKRDHSTYTDPELVEYLVQRIVDQGFSNIKVVEAQSTYGQYFTNRGVRDVAEYLGFDITGARGYEVVDLTLDEHEEQHFGSHLGFHPAPRTWKNADFRIAFAKNKTHAYAYYTLTLKNIYGALPLGDKFIEYHCKRDIYHTTMEYLKAFPVHFGLIDAHLSADGPFGIFADAEPNLTETIIGGDDLVAVDWVGASKMGLDPMISEYMRLAVCAFGKPEIDLAGEPDPYWPWLNVPWPLTLFAHKGLDASDYFGNLIYMVAAYMDEDQFQYKSKDLFVRMAHKALLPIQTAVFLQAGGDRTLINRWLGGFLTWLGNIGGPSKAHR